MKENLKYLVEAFYINESLLPKNPIFLHIGTFTGKLEKLLTKLYPSCSIYSIEPHPDNFAKLRENVKELTNVYLTNKAIVSTNDNKVLLAGVGSCASTYKATNGIEVDAITLEKFVLENNISNIDCIFYNAEGSEMEFLPYLVENKMCSMITQICLNFHTHVQGFGISYENAFEMMDRIKIHDHYVINDDRSTRVASIASGGRLSELYPCFLFYKRK